jgi:hypothetical protein
MKNVIELSLRPRTILKRFGLRILFMLLFVVLGGLAGTAQSDRGTLTGLITDPAGFVVPDTAIVMRNLNTGEVYKQESTSTGSYSVSGMPAGKYALSVSHAGFKDYVQTGITIQVAVTTRQNVTLTIGSASETVEVNADASLLKTQNAEISTTISRTELNELPIPFSVAGAIRDPLLFAKLAPGVETNGVTGNNFRIDGLPTDSFKITVDGQDTTNGNLADREDGNHPGVEMLEEFTLQSSNFSAEFGQVGGGLFNFTARSGTNSLHGSIYENFANEALNSNQPFSNLTNVAGGFIDKKTRTRQNDYGFTIGGPVRFPFLYDGRKKTFFFAGWEHYGQANSSILTQTVPTARMRTGDFGEILTGRLLATDVLGRPVYENTIYDPATARCTVASATVAGCGAAGGTVVTDPFPNNVIPTSRLDPVAAKIQAYIPLPQVGGLLNNYSPEVISPITNDLPGFKVDQVITQNFKTSFYFSRLKDISINSNDGLPLPISAQRPTTSTVDTYRLNNDYTVTPNILVHFGVGYIRYPNQDSSPPVVQNFDAKGLLGLPNAVALGFPRIGGLNSSFGGIVNGNGNGLGPTQRNIYEMDKATAVANATWTHGNHTYKGGSEYKNDQFIVTSAALVAGSYGFSSAETSEPYKNSSTYGTGSASGSIGLPYASFLLGQVDNGQIGNAVISQYHRPAYSLFVQDTWKARRNLTIDYGLRWDITQTLHEHDYRTSGFSPTAPNPNAGGRPGALTYEGFSTGECHCNFSPAYPYALGPRLAIAFSPDEKTVFRGGFAVTYGQNASFDYAGSNFSVVSVGFNTIPFSAPSFGIANTTLSNGFQYSPSAITSASRDPGYNCCTAINGAASPYFSPNGGRPPRIFNMTASMERQFGRDLALEIAYVGNRASWLVSGDQGNLGLQQFNALSYAALASFGLNAHSTADAALLAGTYSAAVKAFPGRFPLPYATFPVSQPLAQALRPFPQYGTIYTEYSPDAKSWYDSMQIKLTKRLSRGLEFLNSFTWSKELDEGTDTERGRGAQINNALNRSSNKYLTSSYVPYINSTSITYTAPAPPLSFVREHFAARELLGGWTIGALLKYQNGQLIRVPGSNPSYTPLGNILERGTFAQRVPGVPLYLKNPNCHCFNAGAGLNKNPAAAGQGVDPVLNYAAWMEPGLGNFSNGAAYDNDYRWQRQPDEEINIGKKFAINVGHKEPATLQIRAEFFDIFNRVFYPMPSAGGNFEINSAAVSAGGANNQTTSAFGVINPANISTTTGHRTGQLVARFQF